MEINKQLFEDVLDGKLKGTFILRNGLKHNSDTLSRNEDNILNKTYLYCLDDLSYTQFGYYVDGEGNREVRGFDIIDFIPDMKENELTIEIPDGKIVDWDESKKQNKIVLKDKQLTYEDVCKKLCKDGHFYITSDDFTSACDRFANTQHQIECILAKNKLANIAVYLNNGWKPSKTDLGHFDAYVLYATPNKNHIGYVKITDCAHNSNVLFKSKELAQQAVEILGEETVKLALEPLGI